MQHVIAKSPALSLPNLITYGRIAAVPAIALAILGLGGDPGWSTAVALFALAAVSDYLDGLAARSRDQQSDLGRMLDPIADKLLVGVVLLLLVAEGVVAGTALWAAMLILSREILVSGLREYLAGLAVTVHVTRLAKWKTAIQLIALGVLLAAPIGAGLGGSLHVAGLTLLWVAAALTAYTGYAYLEAAIGAAVKSDGGTAGGAP
jgi:CDP-diacylglycerol--glycerol-3-phosphate 3-phosphatidyltransferase